MGIVSGMPIIALCVKAQLENLSKFRPAEHHQWCIDFKNTLGEEYREGCMVSPEEEIEIEGGGSAIANFCLKWEGAKKQSFLTFHPVEGEYTAEMMGDWAPL